MPRKRHAGWPPRGGRRLLPPPRENSLLPARPAPRPTEAISKAPEFG